MHLKVVVPAAIAALLIVTSEASATVLIDDFTAGSNFTLVNPASGTTVNFVGTGPIGGTRQIVASSVFGNNTTALNTGAGTLSISTTGFSDTFVRYGAYDSTNGAQLNLALAGTESMQIVFSAFHLGGGDAGGGDDGLFLVLQDGAGHQMGYSLTGPTGLNALNASNGGTLSVALSSFTNFGLYNGEIDGVSFFIDDRDITATIDQARFTGGGAPVSEPASLALLGFGLFGLGFSRRKKA